MSAKARIGVIGAGWWAVVNHIPLLKQLPQAQMLSQARRGDQPGVSHQPLVVEGHADTVQTVPR